MSKKNNNNKSRVQPEVEQAVEQVVEKEAIIIDPEVLKAESPETLTEVEEIKETLEEFHNVDAETEISEVLEEAQESSEPVKFEFQDTYFIGGGDPNVAPDIDTLPEEKTREEKIEEIVEAEAQHFDEKEEEFLNSSVEKIEQLPVVDDGCDECDDKDCPCNNEVDPNEVKSEEKTTIIYSGNVIKIPKIERSLGSLSRSEMTRFLDTGILPE